MGRGILIASIFGFIVGALIFLVPIAITYRIIKKRWPNKMLILCIGVIGGIIGVFIL